MKIKISKSLDETVVEVRHGLNDEGHMRSVWNTNNVVLLEIEGYEVLEIDLSREIEAQRVMLIPADHAKKSDRKSAQEWGPWGSEGRKGL